MYFLYPNRPQVKPLVPLLIEYQVSQPRVLCFRLSFDMFQVPANTLCRGPTVNSLLKHSEDPFSAPMPCIIMESGKTVHGRHIRTSVPQPTKQSNKAFKDKQKRNYDNRHGVHKLPNIPNSTEVCTQSETLPLQSALHGLRCCHSIRTIVKELQPPQCQPFNSETAVCPPQALPSPKVISIQMKTAIFDIRIFQKRRYVRRRNYVASGPKIT